MKRILILMIIPFILISMNTKNKEDNMLKLIKGKEKKFEKAIQNDEKLIGGEIDSLNEKHQ